MPIINNLYERITKYDLSLILLSTTIVILGLINLKSATSSSSIVGVTSLFKLQVIYVIIGFILMLILTFIDYRKLDRLIYPIYFLNIFLLILVLFFGTNVSGSRRWLRLAFFNFQPSELMKLSLVLALAKYFNQDTQVGSYTLKKLIIPFIMALIPAGLIIIEPDLGTGLVILLISFWVFLFVKINKKSLLILTILGLISAPLVYNFALKDYQKKRVMTFIDPTSDPRGSGYNSIQSKIAVGSGMVFGKGYKKGTQSQLNFLPEHHTDFIFSVLAEEHGFLGSLLMIILYMVLMLSCIRIASKARDKLGAIICMGVCGMLFWHCFINIGMVLGIMPVVGVALPFLSYGGSSILVAFLSIGLMQSVAIRRFMF